MKIVFLLLAVMVFQVASPAHATTNEEARANFKNCIIADDTWYSRWGQYLAGFDMSSAQNVCQRKMWWSNFTVKRMGCYLNGDWKTAGYYCDEISGGAQLR